MPTTTPNLLRFPASTDTPNVPRDEQRIAEDVELALVGCKLPWFGKPYVESGAALTAPGGLLVAIAAGIACVNGWRFAFTTNAGLAVVASTTNHVWLTQTLDGNGRHSGFAWTVLQATAVPANSVYVGQVVTGAAGITTMDASFRGVIAPGGVRRSIPDIATQITVAGDALSFDIVGDGVSPLSLTGWTYIAAQEAGREAKILVRDGAGGAGVVYGYAVSTSPASNNGYGVPILAPLPAWVGKRTLYYHLSANVGLPALYGGSYATRSAARFDF